MCRSASTAFGSQPQYEPAAVRLEERPEAMNALGDIGAAGFHRRKRRHSEGSACIPVPPLGLVPQQRSVRLGNQSLLWSHKLVPQLLSEN